MYQNCLLLLLAFGSVASAAEKIVQQDGFENWGDKSIPRGWISYAPETQSKIKADTTVFSDGKTALCMEGIAESEWFALLTEKINVETSDALYEFGCMSRNEVNEGTVSVLLRESGLDEKTIKYTELKIPSLKEWELYSSTPFHLQPGTKYIQAVLKLAKASGQVWFDEVFISELAPVLETTASRKYEYENSFSDFTMGDAERFLCTKGKAAMKISPENINGKKNKCLKITALADKTTAFLCVKSKKLIPGETYRLIFEAWTNNENDADKSFSRIAFMDYYGKKIAEPKIKIFNVLKEAQSISTEFRIPEKAAETEFAIGTEDYNNTGTLLIDNIRIEKLKNTDVSENPYYWNSWWISAVDGDIDVQGHAYYRKSFTLNDEDLKIKKAVIQIASNQSAEVYLNGIKAGQSKSWRMSALMDVGKLLKPVKNTLAVSTFNNRAASRILFELYILSDKKKETVIASDSSWRFSMQESEKWERTDFDDSQWRDVYVYGKPPIGPYGFVSYKYQGENKILTVVNLEYPEVYQSGNLCNFSMKLGKDIVKEDLKAVLKLQKDGTEYLSADIVLKLNKGKLSAEFTVPHLLEKGEYELNIVNPGYEFVFPDARTVFPVKTRIENTNKQAQEKQKTFKIANDNFVSIDNKLQPLLAYHLPLDIDPLPRIEYIDDFIKSGINIIIVPFDTEKKKNPEKELDKYVYSVLSKYPEAYIFFSLGLDPDAEWLSNNPAEKVVFSDGKKGNAFSFASMKYRKNTKDYLRKIVKHINNAKYTNRILGYNLVGGEDGQWIHYSGYGMNLPDYSVHMQKYFHEWLKAKYSEITALNKIWRSDYLNFDEIKIPGNEKREGSITT